MTIVKKLLVKQGGGAIAQWIRRHLPSCGPGFESQAYLLRFYLVNIVLYLSFIWETDENKQKEARFGPYFQLQRLLSLCSVLAFIDSPLMDH